MTYDLLVEEEVGEVGGFDDDDPSPCSRLDEVKS
jgi:hypothetical protein